MAEGDRHLDREVKFAGFSTLGLGDVVAPVGPAQCPVSTLVIEACCGLPAAVYSQLLLPGPCRVLVQRQVAGHTLPGHPWDPE